MRLKAGTTITVVEFGLEWRGSDGKWRSQVFKDMDALHARLAEVEAQGATEVTQHMRDRRVEYSPWRRT